MKGSLITRVLGAAGVVLVFFLGVTIIALDIAFRSAAERATRDRLQIQVLALLAVADFPDDNGIQMPMQLPEARFSHPGSGLYAQVLDASGQLLWRSPSAVALEFSPPSRMQPGETVFQRDVYADGGVFRIGLTVLWDTGAEGVEPALYHFLVVESLDSYLAQVGRFRANLFWWFGLVFAALIIAQLVILRRMLRPLRDLAGEVAAVESGRQDLVRDAYPRELSRLAGNLNALIRNERGHLERYRNTLGDLAHSLKTPLAVIQIALEEKQGSDQSHLIGKQVERMNEIVRYQLQRASAVGNETFGRAVVIAPQVADLIHSLEKVYASRHLSFDMELDAGAVFLGSRGDLLEMMGNILDNACKWAKSTVRVCVIARGERGVELVIEDDGPGIASQQYELVLNRGTRADESVGGQGIGLAVVRDLVQQHGGTITLSRSELQGLKVVVVF